MTKICEYKSNVKAYYDVARLHDAADKYSYYYKGRQTEIDGHQFINTKGKKAKKVKQDIIIVSTKAMDMLTEIKHLKLYQKISKELKYNNMFWKFNHREEQGVLERALLDFRKNKILLQTGRTDLHIVNPFAIRKGGLESIIVIGLIQLRELKLDEISCARMPTPRSQERDPTGKTDVDIGYTLNFEELIRPFI